MSLVLVCASLLGPLRGRNCRCCGFGSWALVFHCGLPRQISPSSPNTPPKQKCAPRWEKSIRPPSFYNPTLSANKQVVQICRFSLFSAADGLADGSGEHRTSPFNGDAQSWNGIERLLTRAVVPQPLSVSATTFPTVLSLYIAQGRLRKNIRYPSCGTAVVIWKGKIHQLGLFFLLEACQRNASGWSTAGWPANAKLTLLDCHSRSGRRWSAKLLVFTCFYESVFYSPLSGTNERTRALG